MASDPSLRQIQTAVESLLWCFLRNMLYGGQQAARHGYTEKRDTFLIEQRCRVLRS